ncbi:hypothetical protein FRC12_024017 [Ceratobasidium sp. 428]|nr:hypothetical protein FRC09_005637 [Ceratobasidium sp. 395]KAG8779628.1 hypothetical protein FRC12_024017 [Ceratobasidium sp. 428]
MSTKSMTKQAPPVGGKVPTKMLAIKQARREPKAGDTEGSNAQTTGPGPNAAKAENPGLQDAASAGQGGE